VIDWEFVRPERLKFGLSMQLKELINHIPALSAQGPLDREVAGIAYDSRRITPGMVFVAVRGMNADGHDFIPNAIERGASAIICERNGFVPQRAARIKVMNSREALAQAASAFYGHPSGKLKVVGITGTNGKTTVAFMIKRILESQGIRTGLIGTVRYEIGERVIPAQRTTPESVDIQQMMAQMVRANCEVCVMEVSSHALDQKRVLGVEFDVAIFTNLTQDHLDYHGTMEDYFGAKEKLFTSLQESRKPGSAVINIDDSYGERLGQKIHPQVILTYGFDEAAKVRATQVRLGPEATDMLIETPEESFPCRLGLIGRHNVYNALAAVSASLALKVGIPSVQMALNQMRTIPGRLEKLAGGQPFSVFVDYAHTDDALRNVLATLREVTKGRLLLVFGCGGNRDAGKRPKMGKAAAASADFTIITSDNPRRESAAKIAQQVQEGYWAMRRSDWLVELDRGRAIDSAIRMAKPGDTVLIAGKGHETYQEFEDTVIPFDDRVHAQETLEALGYSQEDEAASEHKNDQDGST
jgi:UDP-N-acetylmuramoyl-L-alanyl-D-glutamate--2,6-diaminopimelate ligase